MTSYSPEKQREYAKAHYQRNKDAYKARAKAWNKRNREASQKFIRDMKEGSPCSDCGQFFHYCQMDFDHTADDKEHDIARMPSRNFSREKIEKEIAKCDLVCANCHRLRTWNRNQAEVV